MIIFIINGELRIEGFGEVLRLIQNLQYIIYLFLFTKNSYYPLQNQLQ